MSKFLFCTVIGLSVLFGHYTTESSSISQEYSTTAVVTMVGGKIAAHNNNKIVEKYKRKDCPVCKGKGWYLSGDGIAKINCQYCEP